MKKLKSTCIIDDDPIFVYGAKRIMKEMEFCDEILVFNNGQEAIDGLLNITARGEKLPSVIFLDLNMPVMDGWEFLEDFVKIPNHNKDNVVVYIISSSVDPRDVERVNEYKIVHNYILKPITHQDLRNVLEEVA